MAAKKRAKMASESRQVRGRRDKPYPTAPLEDVLKLGEAVVNFAGGTKIRRLTLLEKLGRSPGSSVSRDLITNSGKYGITIGSYKAEWIELSPDGLLACDSGAAARERVRALCALGVTNVQPFKALFDEYAEKRLPAMEVMKDFLQASGLGVDDPNECLDIFVVNLKYLKLLRTIGAAETLITIDQRIEEEPEITGVVTRAKPASTAAGAATEGDGAPDWEKICFYVTPIGEEGSEQRKHADLMLASIVQPALDELELRLVRADQIGQPGMITSQVIEHIKRAKLVVADLSTLNPNVFYETALRHACRLPIVQMIRRCDKLPFDIGQVRTVVIDTTDIYSLVPRIATYRAEIATQARNALDDPHHAGNPITVFYPAFFD